MSILAIITARGGSKRIPRKNIKQFMGKPMLAYAIEACLTSGIFDEVMVSTEDSEIADIAQKYNASVPFMRSELTSNDYATTYDVLEEVLINYKKENRQFSHICCVYPCVPFLTAKILCEAYDSFCIEGLPVVKFSYPIQRALKINKYGYLEFREPENAFTRSQDIELMYHDVGMFYFCVTENLLKNKSLIGMSCLPYILNESDVQDIDTEEDWKLAEIKYQLIRK